MRFRPRCLRASSPIWTRTTTDSSSKGYWYHTSDFMRIPHGSDFKGWDGYASDSYFSGVLIKLSRDGEEYMVGTYY